MANVSNLSVVVCFAIVIIAAASVVVAAMFMRISKALMANAESIRLLAEHIDARTGELMISARKSIEDVNAITERVGQQMDRVETIVGNIEHVSTDARSSMHMVDATVVPMLGNLHGLLGGLRKGVDTWNEQGAKKDEL